MADLAARWTDSVAVLTKHTRTTSREDNIGKEVSANLVSISTAWHFACCRAIPRIVAVTTVAALSILNSGKSESIETTLVNTLPPSHCVGFFNKFFKGSYKTVLETSQFLWSFINETVSSLSFANFTCFFTSLLTFWTPVAILTTYFYFSDFVRRWCSSSGDCRWRDDFIDAGSGQDIAHLAARWTDSVAASAKEARAASWEDYVSKEVSTDLVSISRARHGTV
jgi:hypothetical protein